ncbi:triosephosphate isomerase [candidate division WWE3 bacterium]|uniref:Triosephosphate isomerase n=1 Tax=candidate division WWE3 bacterium TaxID=2053526 RepID=A0A955LG51_UNCKA|nr:triosephosphate isomerase [candidate division WWE3 bacterium]
MRYIVANWKQNKNIQQALAWLTAFKDSSFTLPNDIVVVVAAPYPLLPQMRKYIDEENIPLKLAAQDISAHASGAFTGEVGGEQLQSIVDCVIIGHSERRMYFSESNDSVKEKVAQAHAFGLGTFVCIADQIHEDGTVPETKQEVPDEWFEQQVNCVFDEGVQPDKLVFVYEPISAISTFGGQPLTGTEAVSALERVSNVSQEKVLVMYGGSVNADNIGEYWPYPIVAGVMPGGASLDIRSFLDILERAQNS